MRAGPRHDINYVWEKISDGVGTLIRGEKPLRERVANAWIQILARLSREDLSPEAQRIWDDVSKATSQVHIPNESPVIASIEAMEIEEVERLAHLLVALYAWCAREIDARHANIVLVAYLT